ncbi:hypothetical protein SAMN04487976_11961 [Xaviernesmea oryzae]|nr:hypothetical protein SAMN04487976_11961 [Xaviernesmea oryzae]
MIRLIAIILTTLSLSACVAGGGTPANNGAALSASESAFAGTWSGNLPSGKPVRVVVSDTGAVSYYFRGQAQTLKNVTITSSRLSATVGTNGSTFTLSTSGSYVFTWGPTGEVTRAKLLKR